MSDNTIPTPHIKSSRPHVSTKNQAQLQAGLEWLDRFPKLVYIVLILMPFINKLPLFVLGLSINPIWQQSGLSLGVQPGLLPGYAYNDPNVGFTTQALGHLAAQDWLHGIIPWWNPFSGIGLPLAGEMQPNALFLPFVFWLLLPNGVLWLKISMEIIAGLATYALVRELGLGRLAALVAAALFEMNGTFAWTPGPVAVLNVVPFLPLLIYGIEKCRKRSQMYWGVFWVALAIAGSLYAGFPEEAYINGLLALAWTLYRFVQDRWHWRFVFQVATGGAIGLLLAAPILVAFVDYLLQSTALGSHQLGKASLPIQAFGTLFMPYIYGPSADGHGNNFISGIWGSSGGYLGIILVFMALKGLLGKRERGLRVLLGLWIIIALAKTFGIQPVMTIMNHIPMLLDAAFFRYSPPSWEFAAIILVAFSIEDLRHQAMSIKWPIIVSLSLLVLSIYTNWLWKPLDNWSPELLHHLKILFVVNFAAAIIGLLIVIVIWHYSHGERRRFLLGLAIVANAAILYVIPELSAVVPGKIDDKAVQFLKIHADNYRFFTVGPFFPNYPAYYRISSLNYNYLPVPKNLENFISKNLFPEIRKYSGVVFWPGAYNGGAQQVINRIHNYEDVGVKYMIFPAGTSHPGPGIALATKNFGNTPLVLMPGQKVEDAFKAPDSPSGKYAITGLNIFQGNYNNTADGILQVTLCAQQQQCVTGASNLRKSRNNAMFYIPFAKTLTVTNSTLLSLTIHHIGGTRPEALWLWPGDPSQPQQIKDQTGRVLSDKSLQMVLVFPHQTFSHKVYEDKLLQIYALPHPAPFYSFIGPECTIFSSSLEQISLSCKQPSALLRRELYMPGWSVDDDGQSHTVLPYDSVFQTIPLSKGLHHLKFRFEPPYIQYAFISFFIGIIGIVLTLILQLLLPQPSSKNFRSEASHD